MRFSHQNQMKKWSIALVLLMLFQIIIPMIQVFAQETDSNTNSADEKGLGDTFISEPIPEGDDAEVQDVEVQSTKAEDEKVEDTKVKDTEMQDDTNLQEEGKDAIPAAKNEGSTLDIKSGGKDLGNIFTFNFLRLGGKDGEDIEDGDIINIVDGTKVALEFAWDTVGRDAIQGDWAAIQLPDVFKSVNISNVDIMVNYESGLVSVGKYSINDGELKFVFNENIENIKNGVVGFNLEFDLIKFKGNIEQKIEFKDSKDKTLTVIAKPIGNISSIDKEGHPDKKHDAKEINWTIDVLNIEEEAITNATVKDIIPEGIELKANSFVINELTVDYNGEVSVGNEVTTIIPTTDSDGFEIAFASMAPYKGYRIQYTTTINDYSKDKFTNDATLSYGGKDLPANATVDKLTRSNPIEKDGWYDSKTNLIEWRLYINKSGSEIDNAIIHDQLPGGLTIVPESIKVYKIVNGQPTGPVESIEAESFPITLGKLEPTDEYEIRFQTSIDYSKINDGNYQKTNEFINKTELKNEKTTVGESEKKVTITRDPILSKVGKSNVNYENKTLTWTVEVNKAGHPLTGVTLTDLIPAGLSIKASNIVVKNEAGAVVNIAPTITKITSGTDIGKTKIEISLGDIGTEKYTITYTTEIEDFTIKTFSNIASLGGIGVGEGGTIGPVPITPPENTFDKSYKGIDYNAKTMDWELRVNPIREAISELKIVDTFPNKGLILLPDKLVVKVGADTLTKGTDYTLTPNTEGTETGYDKGFTITLNSFVLPLNKALVVTYSTSYNPQLVVEGNTLDPHINAEGQNRIYKNKAQFIGKTINNNPFDWGRDAQITVREDSWNSGKKEGQLLHFDDFGAKKSGWVSGAERKIAWQLYINYQQQNLGTGVEVVDTLAYQGTIDQGSIKVSEYEVNKDGTTAITESVLPKINYKVTFDADGKFTLKFADGFTVDKRYVIEFLTTVPDISQNKYTNNAVVKVGGKEFPYTSTKTYDKHDKFLDKNTIGLDGKNDVFTGDEVDWEVKVNESLSIVKDAKIVDTISKGLVYVNDSLKVYKLIGNQEIELEEVTDYAFAKSNTGDGKTVLTLDFTDDVDTSLLLRYKTVVTATEDKVNNKVDFRGTGIEIITKESESLSASQFSYVGGVVDPKKGMLEVTKRDSEEEKVISNNEAQFTLWYKLNGNYVQFGDGPFTTSKGVLTIKNLPLRTYYLREAKAPEGYVLSNEEKVIVVDKAYSNKEENIFKVDVENTKEKIGVTGTKEWVNGENNRPESIQLQLYRDGKTFGKSITLENGETEYTWTDLEKTDIEGNEYVYTIDEVETPENYNKTISEDGLIVTNTYDIPKTEITATKEWVDGPEEKPTVWFKLYRQVGNEESEEVRDAEIQALESGTTEVTWEQLDVTDTHGNEYIYSVQEVNAEGNNFTPENYEKTENGLEVRNYYVSPTDASAKATKEWVKGSTDRPTVWFKLFRKVEEDGELEAVPESEAKIKELLRGTTEVVWTGLTKTDSAGNEYIFSVKEVNEQGEDFVPANYKKEEGGLAVTNTYVIPKTEVTGTKVWINGPKERPDIELQLYRDGEAYADSITLKNGKTEYTWTDLDKTDTDGNEYTYTIDEVEVPKDYVKTVSEDGLAVTNTYTSPKTEITGTKIWLGGPKVKPDIELQLYRNGEAYGEAILLKDGTTSYTWSDLDKTDSHGVEYIYTIDEVEVPKDYVKTVSEDGLTVANTYTSPKTEITGTKIWLGGPKVKPDIELQLYRNGEAYGEAVLLKEGTTSYTWSDLDKTDSHGVEYIYTVDEVKVPEDYKKTLSEDGLTITNTHADYLDGEDDDVPLGGTSIPGNESGSGSGLPKAGTKSTWIISILGFILIVGGVALNRRKRV